MINRKKFSYQEDNKSSSNDIPIKKLNKNTLNENYNKENSNYKKLKNEEETINIKQIRGRQLYPGNSFTMSKKNNSSLATTCESKKRIGNKKDIVKKVKNKALSTRLDYYSYEDESDNQSFSDSYRKRRKIIKEKKYNYTENSKRINEGYAYTFSESKELDLSNENNRESSEEFNNLNDSTEDNFQIIDKMTNEIERILIDIYNNHIKADKNKGGIDISKYERHISETSSNFDRHYNIFILQILSEKIKLLVQRYKEKIFEIPEINALKNKYHENEENLGTKDTKNSKKIEIKHSHNNREKLYIIKKEQTLQFSDAMWNVMSILLLELTNIKNALISSSPDIEKVFKYPLSHLKLNDKIVTFCIQDMHKEEFYSTLLEDRFISFLLRQIKTSAKDGNMEEILKLIENLEHDSFPNNSSKNKNSNKNNGKEMTRFSSFLDLQLKEIVERQNALEKQILTLKANNDINTLSNLNNLINEKVEEIYSKSEIPYNNNKSPEISNTSSTKINNNISHSIIKECNHHFHSHSNNPHSQNTHSINTSNEKINYKNPEKNIKNHNINCKDISTTNPNTNVNGKINNHISKNMMGNFSKNENYSTIDELVNYIETNNNDNKTKKNKKKIKNSKKKTQQNKSPSTSINKNQRVIDETVIDNFRNKIYNDSSMAYQIRKIKPSLSVKWLKSINNI